MMKVYLLLITILFFNNLFAQKSNSYSNKELDTSFFDYSIYHKYFEDTRESKKYHIPDNNDFNILIGVASFNSSIGKLIHDIVIKPKFKLKDSFYFKSVSFEFEGHPIQFTFKSDNGVNLFTEDGFEGTENRINLTEYKKGAKNGINIHYYWRYNSMDTFILERKYFKDDYPVGKYYSYFKNGQIKVEGDSTYVFNKRLEEEEITDLKGNVISIRFIKAYDTEKKCFWRIYDEKGNLMKEEFYK